MIATNLALSNFTTDFSVVSYHSSKSSSDFVVKWKFNSCWVGCKLLTSGFGGWSVPVGSGVVSYTSQWDYTTLHARTSFTTCPPTLTAGRRVCGPGGAGWLARPPCPRRWPSVRRRSVGPSWDLDKQPFVFVDAFVSPSAARPTASTQPRRPTLFLTYLFSAPAHRLIPLLCAFYFTQRSRSKWRKAIVDRCSVRQLSTPSYRVADEEELHTGGVLAYEFYRALFCNAVEQSSIHENRSSFDKRGSARRETLAMLSVGFCGSLV